MDPIVAFDPTLDPDTQTLIAWLATHDEHCPNCGYGLRGLTVPACPECACTLRLGVTTTEPAPVSWILALIACALAAGFDLVSALLLGWQAVTAGAPPGAAALYYTFLASLTTLGLASAAGMLMLIRKRTAWRRLPPDQRRRRGLGIFLLVAAVHGTVGLALLGTLI